MDQVVIWVFVFAVSHFQCLHERHQGRDRNLRWKTATESPTNGKKITQLFGQRFYFFKQVIWVVTMWISRPLKSDVIDSKKEIPQGATCCDYTFMSFYWLSRVAAVSDLDYKATRKWALVSDEMKCVHPPPSNGTYWSLTSQFNSKSQKVQCSSISSKEAPSRGNVRVILVCVEYFLYLNDTVPPPPRGNPRHSTSLQLYLEPADEVVSCEQLVEYELKGVVSAGLI